MSELWVALALVLVIEGLLPALSPRMFRTAMRMMAEMDERSVRVSGVTSMVLGALLLYWIKH